MADEKTEDRSDEMEHDLHKLEDHIADAEKKLEARKDDTEHLASDQEQAKGEQDEPSPDDDDPDERVEDEVANPT